MSGNKPLEIKPREGKWIFHEDILCSQEYKDLDLYGSLGDFIYIDKCSDEEYTLCYRNWVISSLMFIEKASAVEVIEKIEEKYCKLQFSLTERHKAEILLALGGKLLVDLDEVFDILNNWRRS